MLQREERKGPTQAIPSQALAEGQRLVTYLQGPKIPIDDEGQESEDTDDDYNDGEEEVDDQGDEDKK